MDVSVCLGSVPNPLHGDGPIGADWSLGPWPLLNTVVPLELGGALVTDSKMTSSHGETKARSQATDP